MSGVGTELVLIAALLLLNGLLAMSEIAVVSARKARLRQLAETGDSGARSALALTNNPTRFLSTVQIGITLVGILAGAFGGATIAEQISVTLAQSALLAPYSEAIGLTVVVVTITLLSLIVGELVPKRLALNNPERIASRVAGPMTILANVSGPVVWFLTIATDGILRVLGVGPPSEAAITEEEVRVLIAEGTEAGIFDTTERSVVESAFDLSETRVVSLMTPRTLVDWLDTNEPLERAWAHTADSVHAYYPVCNGSMDEIVGVVSIKDVARRLLAGENTPLTELARPPLFLPEQLPAYRALERFKQADCRLGLVIDQHGSVAGVLTPTDLFEALLGELAPEHNQTRSGPVRRDDGSWLLDGLMLLHDVEDLLELADAGSNGTHVQTLGGLVMATLGRIPSVGERFVWRGWTFEVVDMDGRRVDKLLAMQTAAPAKLHYRGES